MENNNIIDEIESQVSPSGSGAIKILFSSAEEHECYLKTRSKLIKLLYLIESEERGEGDISAWFDSFIDKLHSANSLCNEKLTDVLINVNALYKDYKYKTMTHSQIKRQIMESKGILDHLIDENV